MKTEIKQDVFDITQRLKKIDKSYFVVFDHKKNKYELHSSEQVFSSYCLTIPYEELDERTLELALKTRKENQDRLLAEMEKQNKLLAKQAENAEKEILRSYYES